MRGNNTQKEENRDVEKNYPMSRTGEATVHEEPLWEEKGDAKRWNLATCESYQCGVRSILWSLWTDDDKSAEILKEYWTQRESNSR